MLYPDMLIKHEINEVSITCFDKPCKKRDISTLLAYMERYHFFTSALKYTTWDKIHPIMHIDDFETIYMNFINFIYSKIDMGKIHDITLGCFRMPKDYYRKMEKNYGNHFIHFYPFDKINNEIRYNKYIEDYMITFVKEWISNANIYKVRLLLWIRDTLTPF